MARLKQRQEQAHRHISERVSWPFEMVSHSVEGTIGEDRAERAVRVSLDVSDQTVQRQEERRLSSGNHGAPKSLESWDLRVCWDLDFKMVKGRSTHNQGAYATMDLTGIVSTLESHWVVLDAELSEIRKDFGTLRALTRKHGEFWNRPMAHLKKLRTEKENLLKECALEH